jgi:hypothetical protein
MAGAGLGPYGIEGVDASGVGEEHADDGGKKQKRAPRHGGGDDRVGGCELRYASHRTMWLYIYMLLSPVGRRR